MGRDRAVLCKAISQTNISRPIQTTEEDDWCRLVITRNDKRSQQVCP